jgi:hypothetical protein
MGGELSLVVEFKDRPPVKISGLTSVIKDSGEVSGEEYL